MYAEKRPPKIQIITTSIHKYYSDIKYDRIIKTFYNDQ